jgi:hypothetical protein
MFVYLPTCRVRRKLEKSKRLCLVNLQQEKHQIHSDASSSDLAWPGTLGSLD